MALTEREKDIFADQFSKALEALGTVDGLTVLGFAMAVVTVEGGCVTVHGGLTDVVSASIDLLSSAHHTNQVGPAAIDDLIEEYTATVN